MATQRRIRRLVIGALFLCLTICTLVVKQYVFALLLGSATYWLILSGIFEAFSDEPDPETGRPATSKAWVLAGLAFFIAIAGLFAWLSPTRGQTHKTAEDIQLTVDRSGSPDAGLHQRQAQGLPRQNRPRGLAECQGLPRRRSRWEDRDVWSRRPRLVERNRADARAEQSAQLQSGV